MSQTSLPSKSYFIVTKSSREEFLPDLQSALLKSKDSVNEVIEMNEEKITHDRESGADIKRREQEQKQELLVALTNKLFEQVEKISAKKPKSTKNTKSNPKEKSTPKSKIEFTGLSWYKSKLEDKAMWSKK